MTFLALRFASLEWANLASPRAEREAADAAIKSRRLSGMEASLLGGPVKKGFGSDNHSQAWSAMIREVIQVKHLVPLAP